MIDLICKAKEIQERGIIENSKTYNLICSLAALSKDLKALEIQNINIRFQDYCDSKKKHIENYEYFRKYYNDIPSKLGFIIFCLKKEIQDIIECVYDGSFTIEQIDVGFGQDSYFDEINTIFNELNECIFDIYEEMPKEVIDSTNIINYIVFPSILSDIENLSYRNKSGRGDDSIKRSMSAVQTLMCSRYMDKTISSKCHLFMNGRGHGNGLKLTKYNIPGERYSTAKTTKVAFFKLPILPENLEILKIELDSPNLESIYFVTGFCNFENAGLDEMDMYDEFKNFSLDSEEELSTITELTVNPFTKGSKDKLIKLIVDSKESFNRMNQLNLENQK